jgi:hypothetical protein
VRHRTGTATIEGVGVKISKHRGRDEDPHHGGLRARGDEAQHPVGCGKQIRVSEFDQHAFGSARRGRCCVPDLDQDRNFDTQFRAGAGWCSLA